VKAVGIAGSPRSPSKSRALLECVLAELAGRGYETRLIDVAALPAEALLARGQSAEMDEAARAVGEAEVVVAASPTYRALYTGALKCFFDLLAPGSLRGKVCAGLQTGVAAEHALASEYGFGPLFASLEGLHAGALYARDDEFADGVPGEDLRQRAREFAERIARLARA
jgi:FMN reductase